VYIICAFVESVCCLLLIQCLMLCKFCASQLCVKLVNICGDEVC